MTERTRDTCMAPTTDDAVALSIASVRRYLNAAHIITESARELADDDPDEVRRRALVWNGRWEAAYGS